MSYSDPSRTILTWNEFGNIVSQRISELSLSPITTPEQLTMRLLLIETELESMFENYIYLMMTKGIFFAVEQMNRVSPQHHFASEWTPADDTLLTQLMERCHEYLTKWTADISTKATKEIDVGIKLGESLDQIGQRVSQVLETSKSRGVLIARTELMRAFNTAAKNRYQKAGFNMKWITARDPQVCELCEPLDGQIVETTPPAHPLCYSENTEILTIDGFKQIKDCHPNEIIATLNPNTFEFEWQATQRKISYEYNGNMINIKDRNLDLLMTPDHQVPYISKWTKKLQWKPANKLAVSDKLIRNCKSWQGTNFSISFDNLELTLELFTKFMAWWLSDGSVTKRTKNCYQIKISQEERLDELLKDLEGFPSKFSITKNGICLFHKEFGEYLTKFGKSWEKYIPQSLKNAPTEILKLFLNTYVKADGSKRKSKHWKGGRFKDEIQYYTSSKRLANDLAEIIVKIGKHASIKNPSSKPQTVYDKRQRKTYTIKHPTYVIRECNSNFTHIQKKYIHLEPYRGQVYCVEVPNHIILVKRNGKMCWNGNCRCTIIPVLKE